MWASQKQGLTSHCPGVRGTRLQNQPKERSVTSHVLEQNGGKAGNSNQTKIKSKSWPQPAMSMQEGLLKVEEHGTLTEMWRSYSLSRRFSACGKEGLDPLQLSLEVS